MAKILVLAVISCVLSATQANYNGPFLLWGPDILKNINIPALANVDEQTLKNIYSDVSAVVVFVRNSTNALDSDNYPTFAGLATQGPTKYLSQYWLPADPIDYNVNTEVIKSICNI